MSRKVVKYQNATCCCDLKCRRVSSSPDFTRVYFSCIVIFPDCDTAASQGKELLKCPSWPGLPGMLLTESSDTKQKPVVVRNRSCSEGNISRKYTLAYYYSFAEERDSFLSLFFFPQSAISCLLRKGHPVIFAVTAGPFKENHVVHTGLGGALSSRQLR